MTGRHSGAQLTVPPLLRRQVAILVVFLALECALDHSRRPLLLLIALSRACSLIASFVMDILSCLW